MDKFVDIYSQVSQNINHFYEPRTVHHKTLKASTKIKYSWDDVIFQSPEEDWDKVANDDIYQWQMYQSSASIIEHNSELRLKEAVLWNALEDLKNTFKPISNTEQQEINTGKLYYNFKLLERQRTLSWVFELDIHEYGFGFLEICEDLEINSSKLQNLINMCCHAWAYNSGTYPKMCLDNYQHHNSNVNMVIENF